MRGGVILLTKQDRFSRTAQRIARSTFAEVTIFEGAVGDAEPASLKTAEPGLLLSFLSPWIVRQSVLDRCRMALNFHPGPVEYPGIGCYNFAIYEGAREFGAVCHHMLAKVDSGRIVMERRFPMPRDATVEQLKLETMETMIAMFAEIAALLATDKLLPVAQTHWTRRPFRRSELEALKRCDHMMSEEEISLRVRSTIYPGYPGPVLNLADGSQHVFPVPERPALA